MQSSKLEEKVATLDSRKASLKEEERKAVAELHRVKEQEDDEMVRAYWAERAEQDPDDPEVLRARADLIAKDRGEAPQNGVRVTAKAASVKSKAH